MISKEFTIINKLGLHARAAAKFVALASKFAAEIHVERNNRQVNGKSIMGVMMLAAAKGTTIQVTANGEDETPALEALESLILNRFDEKE